MKLLAGALDSETVAAAGLGRRHAGDAALLRHDMSLFSGKWRFSFRGSLLLLDNVVAGAMDGLLGAV